MSDSQGQRYWSDNPNAPKIPYWAYFAEKSYFAGNILASVLYGTLIVLFFQCMAALFNPVNRRGEGIRWWLVSYTVFMFLFVTVVTGTGLHIQSICFIGNREYSGVEDALPPGPLGYKLFTLSKTLSIVNSLMFLLNYWLADGLLLYRCYVIYSSNPWAVAFPCLVYLGSVAMGTITLLSQTGKWNGAWATLGISLIAYISVAVFLNTLLTLMIVIRLVLHGRNIRTNTGSKAGIGGLYGAVAAMFIESSALYAVNSLLLIGLWAAESGATNIFLPVLGEIQAIAPLLIIKRVATKSSLASSTMVTGRDGLFNAGSRREPADRSALAADGGSVCSVDEYVMTSGGSGVGGCNHRDYCDDRSPSG